MKNLAICALLSLSGCLIVPDFSDTKLVKIYVKEVDVKPGRFNWYFHSLISNFTPDFIVYANGDTLDTLCVSTNVAQFFCINDTIGLGFYGAPMMWSEPLKIPAVFRERFVVTVDTSCEYPSSTHARYSYTKKAEEE